MNIFFDIGIGQITRILGMIDRNPDSETYGCCDRYYWHYKVLDFSNSRYQEASLSLSLAAQISNNKNRYFDSNLFKEWVRVIIYFWAKKRHSDGSTDESYPNERHYCSTALSLFAISESMILSKMKDDVGLSLSGDFVMAHDRSEVGNQIAGAAVALYNLYILTGDVKYKVGYEDKINLLFSVQDPKGFYPEYGGFDLGYCSITLSFLAVLYKKTQRDDIWRSAQKCIKWIDSFIDSDGYYSSDTMSRKTQYLYTYGFAVFFRPMLEKISAGLNRDLILNPSWMDDRYCIPFTNDYLMTALEINSKCL